MVFPLRRLKFTIWFLLALSCFAFIFFVPIQTVEVKVANSLWLRIPVSVGGRFETLYVHSVQKTPVIDEYVISCGRIWQWQEKVKSHNAGLPFGVPRNGKFIASDEWFYFRGGRFNWNVFFLRVGNHILGKNVITFRRGFIDNAAGARTYKLFAIVQGKKLAVGLSPITIAMSLFSKESLVILPNMVE